MHLQVLIQNQLKYPDKSDADEWESDPMLKELDDVLY